MHRQSHQLYIHDDGCRTPSLRSDVASSLAAGSGDAVLGALGDGLDEVVHGLVVADEAHEPEVVGVDGDDVDVLLRRALLHRHRLHRRDLAKGDHNLHAAREAKRESYVSHRSLRPLVS